MKVTKLSLLAVVLASGVSLAASSFAGQANDIADCPHHHTMAKFGPDEASRPMGHMLKGLDLTDAQKVTLKSQRDADAKSREQLQEKLLSAREALQKAVVSGASDSQLQSLAGKLGQLESERALAMAKGQKAFLAVLTPEQKQKLEAQKAERQEKMKARMEKHQQARDAKRES